MIYLLGWSTYANAKNRINLLMFGKPIIAWISSEQQS